ncbi:MAG: UDP-N-acetylmuramoyl-L-alanyl-D-glutamate--2,6-diaminopimelate ligase, partial [Chitinophagales bacterium]|nr:UDP-N-acetylmuramoyl-L-alanyl-D-glutamate--2,6-diaminopimelate ligase [Chitinophagales bacterium]
IFTSDNPRFEDPHEILKQMLEGVAAPEKRKVLSIPDRREAIRTAVHMAERGDIILVAGKGHEKYQEINGIKYPFDDKMVLKEAFEEMEK